jgi:hypothetical protein
MGPGLIVLLIVVGISLLISVASNWLRSQQRQAEIAAAERRARNRSSSAPVSSSTAGKAGAGDIDRFLEEINKLRQKPAAAADPTASRPVAKKAEPARPVAKAAPVARRADPVPPPPPPVITPLPRLEDLPVAPVVARPLPPPPASVARAAVGTKVTRTVAPQTPFGRQLVGLLADPKSVPMAVVLQEILGPPRCKRPPQAG